MMRRLIQLFFSVLLCVLTANVEAHELQVTNKLAVSSVGIGTNLDISNPLYVHNDPNFGVNYVQSHQGIVTLVYGRENRTDVNGSTWHYELNYNLIDQMSGTVTHTGVVRLESSNVDGIYESAQIHENVSGRVRLEVTSINASSNVPNDVRLEMKMKIERFDYLNPSSSPLPKLVHNSAQEVTIKWPYMDGAEYYELEWVFWDLYNTEAVPTDDEVLFKNAIRTQVNDNHYTMDFVYPAGIVYYRFRPVGRFVRNGIDPQIEKRGAWSDKIAAGGLGFENDKNWQFARAYAEDGKFTQGIHYFDNGLKGRQSLTNLNSEDITVISETVYDVENRPSLAIMPVPVKNDGKTGSKLAFGGGLNGGLITTGAVSFPRTSFDQHNKTAPSVVASLPTNHIANQYYSKPTGIDPFENHIHRNYVPNAEGYPMAQVQFMNDGTGRVRKQSGVGPFYQLDNGQEGEYFYSNPTNTELQRMFGQNVGEAKYYKKNYHMDANGQIHVAYLDQAGQVIATALAGAVPDNVLPLDGSVQTRRESLMGSNQLYDVSRTSEAVHQLFCDQPQTYKFTYDLEAAVNVYSAAENFCVGCTYDLEISVVDEHGAIVPITLPTANAAVTIAGGVLTTSYDNPQSPCTGQNYSPTTGAIDFEVAFSAIGNYTVRKILIATGPDIDDILTTLQQNGSIMSESDFIDDYVVYNFDSTECTGCSDALLLELSMALVDAESPGAADSNPDTYNRDVAYYVNTYDCSELLERYSLFQGINLVECQGKLEQMKAQMSPGGCLYERGNFYTELFVTDGETMPLLTAYSATGAPSTLPTSSAATFAAILEDPAQWQDHWIDDLVQFHPEYCRYENCNDPATIESKKFDYELFKYSNWEDVAAFYQVSGPITYVKQLQLMVKLLVSDPSVINSTTSALGLALGDYCNTQCSIAIANDPTVSCNCGHPTVLGFLAQGGPMGTNAPTTSAEHWARFRGIYMAEKLRLYYENLCPLNYPSSLSPLAYGDPNYCQEIFGEQQVPMSSGSAGIITGMTSVQQLQDAIQTNITNGTASTSLCNQLCSDRAEDWIEDLCTGLAATAANNPALMQEYNNLKQALEDYCLDGCGSMASNPMGYLLSEDLSAPVNTHLAIANGILTTIQTNYGLCVGTALTDISVDRVNVYQPYTTYYNVAAGIPMAEPKCSVLTNVLTQLTPLFPVVFSTVGGNNHSSIAFNHPNITTAPNQTINGLVGVPSSTTYTLPSINAGLNGLSGDAYYDNWSINSITLNNEHQYSTNGVLENVNNFIQIEGNNFCQTCNPTNNCNSLGIEFITASGESVNPMEIISMGTYDCATNLIELTITDVHCGYPNNNPSAGATACPSVGVKTLDAFVRINNDPCNPEWELQHGWVPISTQVHVDANLAQAQCDSQQLAELTLEAQQAYQNYVNTLITQMLLEDKCLDVNEDFVMEFQSTEQHYTLYYYDAIGDLVQTLPPAAVQLLDASPGSSDFTDGILNPNVHPNHDVNQFTTYRYNSLGQVITQQSPDGGLSKFFYDAAQRLRLSQNANQAPVANVESSYGQGGNYAYTKFDKQGRITEVGRLTGYIVNEQDLNTLNFPQSGVEEQTFTEYDNASGQGSLTQHNLRSRVARSYNDHIATYYDYDIHGNVKTVQHQIEKFGVSQIDYKYDLISGNVNEVAFQKGTKDQFFHRYRYDADNRLTKVFTSKNGCIWDNDARYFYYAHGPMARVEVGQDKVQGMDYYYNLQGWLKGVNNTTVSQDLGLDGYIRLVQNDNQWFGKDEYGFYLGYHRQDYKPIGGNIMGIMENSSTAVFDNDILGSGPVKGLYNGNISFMITHIPKLKSATQEASTAMVYQYDALHRIKEARSYSYDLISSAWQRDGTTERYDSKYWYDKNGNLTDLQRWAAGSSTPIDDLHYIYGTSGKVNQLTHVIDDETTTMADDLESQVANNYQYDHLGNITVDASQSVSSIQWNLMNKIDRVVRSNGDGDIEFTYDVGGSRLTKTTYDNTGLETTTVYIRDIASNILATYTMVNEQRTNPGETPIVFPPTVTTIYAKTLKEVMLYGGSRIGVRSFDSDWESYAEISTPAVQMSEILPILNLSQWTDVSTRGDKLYEASNHLGNVLIAFSDKKIGIDMTNDNIAEHYEAIVKSANDYYPFGWTKPGRRFNANAYSFGFNGQIQDQEWMGGQSVAFEFRTQDPRLGRFLSTDPLTALTPWQSPYAFADNSPISKIDYLGLFGQSRGGGSSRSAEFLAGDNARRYGGEGGGGSGGGQPFVTIENTVQVAKDPPKEPGTYEGQGQTVEKQVMLGKTYRTESTSYRWHTGSDQFPADWYTEEEYLQMYLSEYADYYYDWRGNLTIAKSGNPLQFHNPGADKTLVVEMVKQAALAYGAELEERYKRDQANNATGRINSTDFEFSIIEFFASGGFSAVKGLFLAGGKGAANRLRNLCRCGGICFIAGTKVLTVDSLENIESLELGQLVTVSLEHTEVPDKFEMLAENGSSIAALYQTELKSETWQSLSMYIVKGEGDTLFIELLRPNWWVNKYIQNEGDEVYLTLEEIGISGFATVTTIGTANFQVAIEVGNQRAIIGKFINRIDGIFRLTFEGLEEALGVTAKHPIWSVSRERWVDAEHLEVGELAQTSEGGTIKLLQKEYEPETHVTYNIEVYDAHNYFVSDSAILVHNTGGKPCDYMWKIGEYQTLRSGIKGASADIRSGVRAHHMGQNAVMLRLNIPEGYTRNTGLAMNVPTVGHNLRSQFGIVSRSTRGITSHRQLLLRDLSELQRVYGPMGLNVLPKGKLTEYIRANLIKYPSLMRLNK